METKKGKFIVFEGGEAVGKSTQCDLLSKYLRTKGIPNMLIQEPGGTPLGLELRKILKEWPTPLDPITRLLLFNASRVELCKNIINPALKSGITVICDRFYFSTLIYQGQDIPQKTVLQVCELAVQGLYPDHIILLNSNAKKARKRAEARGELDQIEKGINWEKIGKDFTSLSENLPNWTTIQNEEKTPQEIHKEIVQKLKKPKIQ